MCRFYRFLLFILIGLSVLTACNDKDDSDFVSSEDSVYFFVDEVMKYWYLWDDELPYLDVFQFDSPSKLLDALIYNPPDRWSFIDKAETIESLFDEGEYLGFGFMLKFDAYGNLRVPVVYENSEAYELGIRRGNIVSTLNGVSATLFNDYESFFDYEPATFTFEIYDNNEILHTITLGKTTIALNGVLFSDIYNVSGQKTGYIVYDSFLAYSQEELEEVVSYFQANNISELIVDLRYNGGGYISLAQELCEMIMPADITGEVFYTSVHNDKRAAEYNTSFYLSEIDLNLDLDRVFFITTDMSASASELVINSLEPHMEVLTIGTPSHGKPVAMYGFTFQDWVMFPVTAQLLNAVGYGDYFDGLTPDCTAEDGLIYDWGDETEPSLSQAFHYISFGTWDNTLVANVKSSDIRSISEPHWGNRNILILNR